MRIRTIKPEFWAHPILSRLTDEARLVAIGLLNVADDEGYFMAAPALIRSALYPFDEDSTRIRRVLAALSRVGYIEVREHPEQGEIGYVVNFKKHQRIDRANTSKIKAYFDSTNDRRMIDDDSLLEQGTGNRERNREQGKGEVAVAPVLATVEFPACLQTDAFRSAWADWLAYRSERRLAKYKPRTEAAQLAKLSEWGEIAAIASIRDSIRNQWQGLFEPKSGNGGGRERSMSFA